MISNHDETLIPENQQIKDENHLNYIVLRDLCSDLLSEILLSPHPSEVQTKYVTLLGDMATAIYTLSVKNIYFHDSNKETIYCKDIPLYLSQRKELFQALIQFLIQFQENSARDLANQLGSCLYKTWEISSLIHSINTEEPTTNHNVVMLYKAMNGELCIRFINHLKVCEFLSELPINDAGTCGGVIPEQFRTGEQYKLNPKGITPVLYKEKDNRVYCPSYSAGYGEFAVNLGCEAVRNMILKLLKFKKENVKVVYTGHTPQQKDTYNNQLFTCYTADAGSPLAIQNSVIYFNASNKIFTQAGSYIQIDLNTGNMIEGQIQLLLHQLPQLEEEGEVRYGYNNTPTFFKQTLAQSLQTMQDLSTEPSVQSSTAPSTQ
jgi:hypothetical protein